MIKVMQWNTVDIPVISQKKYEDPYRDVVVRAVFCSDSGQTLTLNGFWDGDDLWIVRFAPPTCGMWNYTISFSDQDVITEGTLEAVEYIGENSLYRHGFLQVADNGRYLCYADKTPFFWLADTHWLGLGGRERLNESNFPLFDSMFRGMADYRAMQEYTVYQMNFFLAAIGDCTGTVNGTYNEGGPLWLDEPFGKMNPNFFRNVDERLNYLVSKGITPCLGMEWGHSMCQAHYTEMERAVRYVVARYSALPVVWFVAGEFCGNSEYALWNGIGKAIEESDPYHHVTSIHGNGENFVENPQDNPNPNADYFREEPWFDMVMIQTGHEPNTPRRNIWRYYYDKSPTKPILEAEQAYEGIWEVREPLTREQAYLSIMHGSFGIAYGAEGVWDATWDSDDWHQVISTWWPIPWYDALFLPEARHMTYLKHLFESVSWWKLNPDDRLVLSNPLNTIRDITAKSDSNGEEILVYYPSCPEEYDTDVWLERLHPSDGYTVTWYNTVNGAGTQEVSLTVNEKGILYLPARKVKAQDRMLVLRKMQRV